MQSQDQKPKILNQVRDTMRLRHYSYRTEQTYLDCVRRYLHYAREHGVRSYLSYLATARNISVSIQNQAFTADSPLDDL